MAKEYTVYSSDNKGTWTADKSKNPTKYTCTQTVDNVSFSMAYIKESGNSTFNEPTKYTPWRVYGKSSISIDVTGIQMTKIEITTDSDKPGSATTTTVNEGWTTSYENENLVLSFTSTGATSFKYTNTSVSQVKVSKIVVTGEPISQNLGAIMYNGETANGKTFAVVGGKELTFTAANAEKMTLSVNDGTPTEATAAEIRWTAPEVEDTTTYTLKIKAIQGENDINATVTVKVSPVPDAETYTLVTSADAITDGLTYIIAGDNQDGKKFALMSVDVTNNKDNQYFNALMGTDGEKYGFAKSNNTIAITPIEGANANKIAIITLESNSTDGFKIKNQNGNYLKMGKGKTSMSTTDEVSDATSFIIGLTDGVLTINGGGDYGVFSYNAASPRFTNYAKAQSSIFLYVKVVTPEAPALHSDVATDSDGTITDTTLKFEDVSEGLSIWWRIVPEVTETPSDGMVKEEVEFQKYTEPVTLSAGTKGTLQYYAQHDATGGKSEIQTVKVNVPDSSVGIAGIEAENGEAVYFNLQGVRVQNPENGIFIRVQNGKAIKIMK